MLQRDYKLRGCGQSSAEAKQIHSAVKKTVAAAAVLECRQHELIFDLKRLQERTTGTVTVSLQCMQRLRSECAFLFVCWKDDLSYWMRERGSKR